MRGCGFARHRCGCKHAAAYECARVHFSECNFCQHKVAAGTPKRGGMMEPSLLPEVVAPPPRKRAKAAMLGMWVVLERGAYIVGVVHFLRSRVAAEEPSLPLLEAMEQTHLPHNIASYTHPP